MLYLLRDKATGNLKTMFQLGADHPSLPEARAGHEWVPVESLPVGWRLDEEPPPQIVPQTFPEGIETSSIIFPTALTHDYELSIVDGTPVVDQISASPRKSKEERDAIKAAKKVRVDQIKADLPALLASDKQKDTADAVRMIAELLNLV